MPSKPLAEMKQGACTKGPTLSQEAVAAVKALGSAGRPLVPLNVDGATLIGFIDTGSEATIIKLRTLTLLDKEGSLHRKNPSRTLKGVTDEALDTLCEVTLSFNFGPTKVSHQVAVCDAKFPGDILLGMDLLRRTSFCLSSGATESEASLSIEGHTFPVTYTDNPTLRINVVSINDSGIMGTADSLDPLMTSMVNKPFVHLLNTTELPPHTGCFVEGVISRSGPNDGEVIISPESSAVCISPYMITTASERHCPVWMVNDTPRVVRLTQGTRLGTVTTVEEVFASNPATTAPDPSPTKPASSEPDAADGDFCWEHDEFDYIHGLTDFGYEEGLDFVPGELPPSQALAAITITEDDQEHRKEGEQKYNLEHLDQTQCQELRDLLYRYQVLFDGGETAIGHVPGIQHRIETGDAVPVCTRQWRLPQATRELIRKECDTMLNAGVIEPSSSPWLSPVVLVRKKGGALRFCVDYRKVNAVTTADTYPLPRIDEMIDELGPTDTFTTLDARAAYWSIEVQEEDRAKTAFSDGYRLFQFCRLPFGLSTAPTTFQRTMNLVLSPVLGRHTLAYLDDIVVYSKGFAQHLLDLEETLKLLVAAGLKLNAEKCSFAATTINFLGFTISPDGVAPDHSKVAAIADTPAPRTVKEIRRFLGATGFFRRHIEGYATIAAPLHLLLKKGQHWKWDVEQQQAFEELKSRLVSAPVLKQPDFTRQFELHTDASSIALGAALIQRDDQGAPQAIAYYSRKLRDPETRYPAIDCEALAVVEGVRVFDPYLYGRKFLVLTDHRPLTHIFKHRTKSPRMTRYAHDLSFYDFDIRYKEGPTNYVPDLLSRQVASININELSPQEFATEQCQDPKCQEILSHPSTGSASWDS